MKHIARTLALAAVVAALTMFPAKVGAEVDVNQSQSLDQSLEIVCEAGGYGQSSKCTAKGEQHAEQSQSVKLRDKVLGKVHVPVNTALDFNTTAAALLSTGTGVAALIAKRKIA